MFEESTLYYQSEIPAPKTSPSNNDRTLRASKLSRFEVVPYWHTKHKIYVRQWLAAGSTIKKPSNSLKKWFLVTEYQDKQGNNFYVKHTFTSLDSALEYAEFKIPVEQLPEL